MTVIADASTLIGLSKIDQLSLLSALYGQVTVPRAVYNEIVDEPKTGFDK
jgi:predicted nucleic acid-binding protein